MCFLFVVKVTTFQGNEFQQHLVDGFETLLVWPENQSATIRRVVMTRRSPWRGCGTKLRKGNRFLTCVRIF